MAKKKSTKKSSVAVGTWPTPEKVIGMPTKKGKVSSSRGKYFLTIGRRKMEIPIGLVVSEKEVRKLVDKEVYAVMSGSAVVALWLWRPGERPPWGPMCYIVPPETQSMFRSVRVEIRKKLISEMVGRRIITTKLARELRRGL